MMVKANWSGSYPTLCFGHWTLEVDGKDVSNLIPPKLRNTSMNTYSTYEEWHFDENYLEVFEDYTDGLDSDGWIDENEYWLVNITTDRDIQEAIFYAIQTQDWRHGSCGGCI